MLSGCSEKETVITIVDIGHNNRVELGKQLRIIKQFSPKLVALDFYLVPDSLDRDSILVKELETIKNTVQVVGLHDFREPIAEWDSLEVSHPKFNVSNHGFANLASDDSVLIGKLPMMQRIFSIPIYSFSYVIAENSFGVKEKFRNTGEEEISFDMNRLGKNYKLITADELFSGRVRKEDIADKIVLMGYLGDKEDFFYLDSTRTKKVNGVEVHAAIIDEIIDRK